MDHGDEQSTSTKVGQVQTMADRDGGADAAGASSAGADGGAHNGTAGNGAAGAGESVGGALAQLTAGTRIGDYNIEQILRVGTDEIVYLARIVRDVDLIAGDELIPPAYVSLAQRPAGGFASATPIVEAAPRHPRLLAPLALISRDGADFLAVEALVADSGELAPTVADGARLGPADALMAGAGLADTLSYLHRAGIAHLHVSPDTIAVLQGRAFLTGMQNAERVESTGDEHTALFARDANFLARTLGVLADMASPGADVHTAEALRQIVARGEANGFTGADDVAAACGNALQSMPVLPGAEAAQMYAPLALVVGSASSVGRVREQNQDACACALLDVRDDSSDPVPLSLFLVADGMGGEAHGELASRIAARITLTELVRHFTLPVIALPAMNAIDDGIEPLPTEPPAERLGRALTRSVETANRQIRALGRKLGQTTGSTITAAAICGNRAAIAHIGDSRAYLLRDGSLVRLTEDHSVLARLQAMDHPLLSDPDVFVPRSMLYRSLGQEDEANPDTLEFLLAPGDRLLLCSDGLWDELDDPLLADVLAGATDPHACAEHLIALANEAGGHDNSTAVIAFVQSAPPHDGGEPASEEPDAETPAPSPAEDESPKEP